MSERLVRAFVSAKLRAHEARGQSAAEYLGVLLVVSAIIAGVATTGVGHDITDKLSDLVRDIAGGDTPKK